MKSLDLKKRKLEKHISEFPGLDIVIEDFPINIKNPDILAFGVHNKNTNELIGYIRLITLADESAIPILINMAMNYLIEMKNKECKC